MARKARLQAESGVYHIVLRGNNRLLFVEPPDYRAFLERLTSAAERDCLEVCAYCLFDEAVHLVVKEGLCSASETIQYTVSKYALWYNDKYRREGKLFYDRFASEPLETDEELLDASRYVHRLPLSRGGDLLYAWSSYNNYLKKSGLKSDTLMFLLENSPLTYRVYFDSPSTGKYISDKPPVRLTDAQAADAIRALLDGVTPEEVDALSERQYMLLIRRFKKIEGISVRQLARVLGIAKSLVEKA